MLHQTIEKQLKGLFLQKTKQQPLCIEALNNSGSNRSYFRIKNEKYSYIGTYNKCVQENEAFFSFSDAMIKVGLSVPLVVEISKDRMAYLQQDLGNETLFDRVKATPDEANFRKNVLPLYYQAVEDLVALQLAGHAVVPYAKAFPAPTFDQSSILADLHYFFYYFVKQQPTIEVNEYEVLKAFQRFAEEISEMPSEAFMFRDFQARNIMIHQEKLYYIDFQGGRKGPLQYDLISLLYQAKAALSPALRKEIKSHYLYHLKAHSSADIERFEKDYPMFIYLRLMQVLGAYGFRGLIERKSHFIESIPFALFELEQLLKQFPLQKKHQVVTSLLQQVAALKENYLSPNSIESNKLRVTINSFSFKKKGIPTDLSGNGGGFVFDCRILPNPGRLPAFAHLTGKDAEVIRFLEKEQEVKRFLETTKTMLQQAIDNYTARGFKHLMVNFGCTGGQHRSVYCAAEISRWVKEQYAEIEVFTSHIEQNITE